MFALREIPLYNCSYERKHDGTNNNKRIEQEERRRREREREKGEKIIIKNNNK